MTDIQKSFFETETAFFEKITSISGLLQPNQQNVSRRVGPSLTQDPIPTRPDVGGGLGHLRGTAAEVSGSSTVFATAKPHEQVMSPNLGSGTFGIQ